MAEGLLRSRLAAAGVDASVASAGLLGAGSTASPHSVAALRRRGLDITAHRSRHLDAAAIERADLVLGMTRRHVHEVVRLDRDAAARTFTLKELVRAGEAAGERLPHEPLDEWLARVRSVEVAPPGAADDVDDPVGGPLDVYEACADELDLLLERLVALVWQAPSTRTSHEATSTGRAG